MKKTLALRNILNNTMKEQNYSQSNFAKMLSIPYSTFTQLSNGKLKVSIKQAKKLINFGKNVFNQNQLAFIENYVETGDMEIDSKCELALYDLFNPIDLDLVNQSALATKVEEEGVPTTITLGTPKEEKVEDQVKACDLIEMVEYYYALEEEIEKHNKEINKLEEEKQSVVMKVGLAFLKSHKSVINK